MRNTILIILAALFLGFSVLPVMADGSVDWSIRNNCQYDDQGNCSDCYNYAAVEFYEQSDSIIPKLSILLDGKNIGNITPQTTKPKKGVELENVGSQYFGAVPVYESGYYDLELKNGRKVQLSGDVEIYDLVFYTNDISAKGDGGVNVTINITPMFGYEVPTEAAGITIAGGALNKLGVISTGSCGDYLFTFSLSKDEILLLKDSEVEVVLNIAGDYFLSTAYFWSPYDEDYQSVMAKAVSMAKAKKINKKK